jgi:hypothetical protein
MRLTVNGLIGGILLLFPVFAFGQAPGLSFANSLQGPGIVPVSSKLILPEPNRISPSPHFLPDFALENPTGYSFLCRTELAVENKFPIGIWLKIGEERPAMQSRPIRATEGTKVQLKLMRF